MHMRPSGDRMTAVHFSFALPKVNRGASGLTKDPILLVVLADTQKSPLVGRLRALVGLAFR
jgi:hypothetical protein